MNNSEATFRKNLKNLFEKSGWSQSEFGRKLDISQAQARKYLEGLSSPPFEMLDKIASTFGVKVSDLFSEANAPTPQAPNLDAFDAIKVLQKFVNDRYTTVSSSKQQPPNPTFWKPAESSSEELVVRKLPSALLKKMSQLDERDFQTIAKTLESQIEGMLELDEKKEDKEKA